jgi:hypothetical protein
VADRWLRTQLAGGLLLDALRWHLDDLPGRLSYWLRPYCWRLDDRHWRWQHRHCRCVPPLRIDITCDTRQFEEALHRLAQQLPEGPG